MIASCGFLEEELRQCSKELVSERENEKKCKVR